MRLHPDKPGIRALGVAESFRQGQKRSVLAGVVMRSDSVVDGVALGKTEVGGDDATRSIASLVRRLRRNDINVLLVSGAILSLYNIVDADALSARTRLPVICLTYKETSGIEASIRRHFPEGAETKLEAYRRLGERAGVKLKTGHRVFVRTAGLDEGEAKGILDAFTLQGSVPEPVRVAKLLARAAMAWRS
ncbi:MAG: DUF99 family protein [Nitrososphaerota archaeon]|nr:DUF99 family protein [Nitrososphaerota archaeon]MDG6957448.1 DUF99 family protein [Nitrososphaerota archaeon]MDG6965946.1 DUF99 family protein [Nitrososphaerota archaeon]MDG6969298.1 DUF99 family protein [Nitrososphaerota archaeon]MDG6973916.1 DUF99 family protein [Nitrososphaerota archaeon]